MKHTESETKRLVKTITGKAYHDYATERFPNAREIRISFDGEDALLDVVLYRTPFERIRRITGYLQKTTQWNSAKQAELKDRITHGGEA